MKLNEILAPDHDVLMVEGFYRYEGDNTRIGWDPSTPLNDKWIRGSMGGLYATKQEYGLKQQTARQTNVAPTTRKEKAELQDLGFGSMKQSIPVFYGYNVDTEPHRAGKVKYNRILDAIKGRDGHSMDADAMDAFMDMSVKGVESMMKQYMGKIRFKPDNIVIIPTPSTGIISNRFAKELEIHLQSTTGNPVKIHDVLEPNLKYELGVAHDPKKKPTKEGKEALRKMYTVTILDDFKRGTRDEYEMMEYLEKTEAWIKKQLESSDDPMGMWQLEYEALQAATEAFENQYMNAADPDAWLEKQRAKRQETFGSNVGERQRKVHEVGMGLRTLLYNRMKLKDNAEVPDVGQNTLIVISDDNIDKGSTIGDVYRTLVKSGVVGQEHTNVVGAVMHRLGDARGDFSKELLADAEEDMIELNDKLKDAVMKYEAKPNKTNNKNVEATEKKIKKLKEKMIELKTGKKKK